MKQNILNLFGFSTLACLTFILMVNESKAQDLLTIENAIAIALENNYGIQISEKLEEASAMQVYKSNVGMGPVINWNANLGLSGSRVNQQFLDGRVNNRWGRAFSPNTNISVDMNLFDGGRMQAIYDRLGLVSQLADLQTRLIVQNTVANVIIAYYNIAREQETLEYLNNIIAFYEERLLITEQRWQVGRGSKLDYLQSNTDLNAQLSEKVRVQNNLKNAKVRLNGILNRDLETEFSIDLKDFVNLTYSLEVLTERAKTQNREVALLQKSMEISRKQEEEWQATFKPQVDLSANLGYNYSNTNAGFLTSNQSVALPISVGARWTLFDGNHRKNQLAIAKVNSDIIAQQQKELEFQILTDLTVAYNQFLSDKELLTFEEENKTIAEENLSIALEKFRLGGSSILELNEAQRAYNISLNRLVSAEYSVKLSELELLRLSGLLVE